MPGAIPRDADLAATAVAIPPNAEPPQRSIDRCARVRARRAVDPPRIGWTGSNRFAKPS